MRVWKWISRGAAMLLMGAAVTVGIGSYRTERDIGRLQDAIAGIAAATSFEQPSESDLAALPAPVRRYFAFAFPRGIPEARLVRQTSEGQFRRPRTETFNFTKAEQVIAISQPALMFSATTPIIPGVWARAYDFFANGEMEMKAKILSTLTVVDERETPELNVISLRRWLLESPLYPQALLPGGQVTWQPIDDQSARAIVAADGLQSSMIVYFDKTGAIARMVAEEDGDLDTPYHGSGEHVTRSDYREVDGVMIPHEFVISRMADGGIFPFFEARLNSLSFE
ncbi:hypothetical protein SAMN04487972_12719 [Paracoccus halophilus]|uniref:Uncharacterized protein n=1 Tax=Paracoccus halophilus TaxID=376733 RepID=A0A099EXX9_9RHOB|nr:DUF6544 family protein [Paracoccus halophilus]KGJ02846.1 hypothetical protein IT41_16225 [Paracoccus halophilus]SFA60203.1 hypothetical protein SAMN04487972_12719 [Paracoccus halophilus]